MNGCHATALAVLASCAMASQSFAAEGSPTRGQRLFGACAACHSLRPDQNMTGPSLAVNLKKLDSSERVQAINYCKDTYTVTTANGETRKFWERNLRLKADASDD